MYTGTGTVNDGSLNGITGTVSSALPADIGTNRTSFGSFGSISFPFNTLMDFSRAQTIMIWMRPGTGNSSARRNPYNQAYGGSGTITHEIGGGFTYFFGTNGGDNVPYVGVGTSFSVLDNETAFITVTRNQAANVTNWYKNGVLQNSDSAGGYAATANGSSAITIGTGYTSAFVGNLYSVRVYNVALTATEILRTFNADRWRYGI